MDNTPATDDIKGRRRIFSITQFVTAACLASISSVAASAAQVEQAPINDLPAVVMPGYGPGIAGHVSEGPITPRCRPNIACRRPLVDATVLIPDRTKRDTIGVAVTNASGNFLVTVPPGGYVVHVEAAHTFPRCLEVQATVGQLDFAPVQISCDTGIR
jgi:hypothetical protein